MTRFVLSALLSLVLLTALAACSSEEPPPPANPYPAVISYWRPVANPNLFMSQPQAQTKLTYDLSQCRCSNFPLNYPHSDSATIAPDQGRMAETGATKVDTAMGCATTPEGVMLECMRARGWEPTSCGGRLDVPGGTTCALASGDVPTYPENYPNRNPYNTLYGEQEASPAEERQRYP